MFPFSSLVWFALQMQSLVHGATNCRIQHSWLAPFYHVSKHAILYPTPVPVVTILLICHELSLT